MMASGQERPKRRAMTAAEFCKGAKSSIPGKPLRESTPANLVQQKQKRKGSQVSGASVSSQEKAKKNAKKEVGFSESYIDNQVVNINLSRDITEEIATLKPKTSE